MNKKGFIDKFIKVYLVLTGFLYVGFLVTSGNLALDALLGQLIYAGIYTLVPSLLLALIWEFFTEDNTKGGTNG